MLARSSESDGKEGEISAVIGLTRVVVVNEKIRNVSLASPRDA